MYLFIFDVTPLKDAALFACGLGLVSPERKKKVLTLQHPQVQRLSLGAGLILRHGLALLGCSERDAGIQTNAWGKPVCLHTPHIQFNLSHSGSLVFGGFAVGCAVGVDVEKIADRNGRMDFLALSKRFFHPREHELLLQEETPTERTRLYFRIWTRKESCLKADGRGLAANPASFAVLPENDDGILLGKPNELGELGELGKLGAALWHIREYPVAQEYALAVCTNSRHCADTVVTLCSDTILTPI